jgi:uncharacterized cupredoxin-like copper-binding protein
MGRIGFVITTLALVAAGCGSQSPAPPAGPEPAAGSGAKVTAKLTDFHIELSQQAFTAGTYTFVATNTGKVTHSLEIERRGQLAHKTDNIQPGSSDEVTVNLDAGSYDVFCPVGTHRSQGMAMEIKVSGNSGDQPPS